MRTPFDSRFAVHSILVSGTIALAACAPVPSESEETAQVEEALATSTCPADMPSGLKPDADQRLWFVLHGANLNLDADGNVESVLDAGTALEICRAQCAAEGHAVPNVIGG